jgi:hypothetical protein
VQLSPDVALEVESVSRPELPYPHNFLMMMRMEAQSRRN